MRLRDPHTDQHEGRDTPRESPSSNDGTGIVVALVHDRTAAQDAIGSLRHAGFAEDRVGVAVTALAREPLPEPSRSDLNETGLVGGVLGLLSGVGGFLAPELGPVLAAGWLGPTVLDRGANGHAADGPAGLFSVLERCGVSPRDIDYFREGLRAGGALVAVHAGRRAFEARIILREYGADLGPAAAAHLAREERESDRRYHDDLGYSGPERRFMEL
ncbi:MAG: hypothetical protein H0U85_07430 [Gemmatimonadales bacterium]|nr:hypothetical protein [Gemmatimonadales bacterium]